MSISEIGSTSTGSALSSSRLRRSTLVWLRWMAVAGQGLALLVVYYGLGFSLPLVAAFSIIMLSAALNLMISLAMPLGRRVSEMEAGIQLAFDVIQLSALLWLTGGMSNPFALLLVAPVVTIATTLNRRTFIALTLLTVLLSIGLLISSQPLPWNPSGGFEIPNLLKIGVWCALLISIAFTSLYVWRVASEARRMSDALAATEAVLAHEQKLFALGGLAAAAAHELGTPLATILLTAKELHRNSASCVQTDKRDKGQNNRINNRQTEPENLHMADDLALILSQAQRCQNILKQLANRGDAGDLIHDNLSLGTLIGEVSAPYRDFDINITTHLNGEGEEPMVQYRAELVYGLRNLVENAVSYARSELVLDAVWTERQIRLRISDDGPGFDTGILSRLGEPFIAKNSRQADMRRTGERRSGGMGLGIFIAKTLLERTGAKVTFANQPGGGAIVEIVWPASRLKSNSQ